MQPAPGHIAVPGGQPAAESLVSASSRPEG